MRGTTVVKPADAVKRWVVVDATDQILGRLASAVARSLRGKRRADFTPHVDQGDFVIVLNVEHIKLTGRKLEQKMFKRYTGYPGGLKLIPYSVLMQKRPETALRRAVWGMLSRSRMSRKQIRALKIYKGGTHPHGAQQPLSVKLLNGELVSA